MADQIYMYFPSPTVDIVESMELEIKSYVNGLPFLLIPFCALIYCQCLFCIWGIHSQTNIPWTEF